MKFQVAPCMLDSVGIQKYRIMMCHPDSHQSLVASKHNSAGKKTWWAVLCGKFYAILKFKHTVYPWENRCPPPSKKKKTWRCPYIRPTPKNKGESFRNQQRSSRAAKNKQLIATLIAVVEAEALLRSSCTIIHHSIDLISAGTHAHLHLSCFNFRKVR